MINAVSNTLPVLRTLPDLVDRQLSVRPEKPAFIFEEDSMSYQALWDGSNQVANGLIGLDLKPGQRVGYLGKNAHLYYELLFGVVKAGGVLCPINWRLSPSEIVYILNDFAPEILFVGTEFQDLFPHLKSAAPSLKHVINMESETGEPVHYRRWRDVQSNLATGIALKPDADALQIYTSGTTGHPKGAVLSHRSLLTAYERYRGLDVPSWNVWSDSDVSLIPMPCFHIGGTAFGLTTLAHGATGVVLRNFIPTEVLGYIDRYKISKLFLVPAAVQIIINQKGVEDVDFSQLKFIFYGAAPMPAPLLKSAMDVFGCGFAQFYGMTETSGTITALEPEDHDPNGNLRMTSVGRALPGVEIVIRDDSGKDLPRGDIGEITTRSTMTMNGYWNNAQTTAETIDEMGWLRTGDIGVMDADGYLFLKDRKKDMIISGGENVYPAEVENTLFDHPAVADVAVIGVRHPKWGEAVKACIVLKEGGVLNETDAIAFTRGKIASYKCPKTVVFIDALPRNPSGKVLRRTLRERYKS